MAQPSYIYKKYPSCRYKPNCRPIVVHNQADDEKLLADGWRKTPKDEIIESLPDCFGGREEVIGSIVEKAAGITNIMLRVPKSRRKKDLYAVGDMLGLDLDNSGFSLKKLKEVILDEAGKQGFLKDHLNGLERDNVNSTANH